MSGPTDDTESKRILIVGGGLSGLGLAGFLRQQGVKPLVVENATEWDRVGYGIGLWRNGVQMLERLGVSGTVATNGTKPHTLQARTSGGKLLAEVRFDDRESVPFVAIHRADLHLALREAVPEEWIRMDTTPTLIIEESDVVEVVFDDGSSGRFDLVIGADGVHSTVRELCFTGWDLEDCNTVTWSFWAPPSVTVPDAAVSVWARGTEGFLGRVSGRGLINIATTLSPDQSLEAPAKPQLERTAHQLGWILSDSVNGLGTDTDVFFDRNRRVITDSWATDRVCLIGDAAHALHPISGQGASLALEDAAVLAQEIATTTSETLPDCLDRFVARRRRPVQRAQRQARFEAAVTFTESDALATLRNLFVERTPLFEWFVRNQLGVF